MYNTQQETQQVIGIVREHAGVPIPAQQTAFAAGFDLSADHEAVIPPGGRALIKTGIRLEIPPGFEGQVRPRSGLALKHGITVLNSPGTIDSDYRATVGVILQNHGSEDFHVTVGMRVAQIVFARVSSFQFKEVEVLSETDRGNGGFGSTGT